MDAESKSAQAARLVYLTRDAALVDRTVRSEQAATVQTISVPSAYEAAAEMLAAPTAALVIDLRAMSGRHGGLLSMARELNVETLGFGPLPTGLARDQVAGLRLVRQEDLPAAISEALAKQAAPAQPAVHLAPAKRPKDQPAERGPQRDVRDRQERPGEWLLTPEELSALLEDQR